MGSAERFGLEGKKKRRKEEGRKVDLTPKCVARGARKILIGWAEKKREKPAV